LRADMSETPGPRNCVDLIFSAQGQAVPQDHGYALYGAVSRLIPAVHEAKDIGLFPIKGTPAGNGTLLLAGHSAVRVRAPADRIPMLLPLAGKALELDGHRIRLGVPRVAALVPAATLASPLVLIKIAHAAENGGVTPEAFLASAREKLKVMGVSGGARIQAVREGPRAGQPKRKVIRVKEQTHVGFAMIVEGLTAGESIRLQEEGLGGRRVMGCGLFLPTKGGGR
jgi:CRISPR-associated protein Cas6